MTLLHIIKVSSYRWVNNYICNQPVLYSIISRTNTSVMTSFLSIKYLSVCLSVLTNANDCKHVLVLSEMNNIRCEKAGNDLFIYYQH